ncbi:MAG: tRNA preQ1(34) S-adenosylmethionine ribosyltransferase-isomerase QueA [Lentisphaeria bacterium]
MNLTDFDYELPEELIAQYPAPERTGSRMLVMGRKSGDCEIRNFVDIIDYLRPSDCLVFNDTKVIPARVYGRRTPTGGKVEILFLEELSGNCWHCMMKPGRRLRPGQVVALGEEGGDAVVVKRRREDGTFEVEARNRGMHGLMEKYGTVPIPPYIQRETDVADRERYQTVYARQPGAVAAPTAGLHFNEQVLEKIKKVGVETANVTLHVGPGTFRPVKTEKIEEHKMHEERFELSKAAARKINETRAGNGRVIAVGTTSVRVLESCVESAGTKTGVVPQSGRTRLFMYPPHKPRVTDGLLTNFHLPRSTLLMLVATFSSTAKVLAAYRLAVKEHLRFYSYGDCMLLLP